MAKEVRSVRSGRRFQIGAVLAAALVLAGCGGGESQATAVANLCASLASYSASVTELQGLSPQSTIADVQTAAAKVQTAYAQVEADAKKVKAANTGVLTSAQRSLEEAAKSLPSTTTLEQARTQLQPQLQALAEAYSQVYTSLKCS
jgi:hypothetical protein